MFTNKIIARVMAAVLLLTAALAGTTYIFGEELQVVVTDELHMVTTPVAENSKQDTTVTLAQTAKSAVLLDADSGTVLYDKNSHEKLPPASITKIMTMLLTLEAIDRGQISLDDKVTISQRAASMGGSQMYMEQGEQQPVETLLKGMAIGSANDACVAAAEYVAGTEEIFVEAMNKRAQELGMKDTHFVNTNGLPAENHYTSAYDIGLMSKELLKYKIAHEWFNTWQTKVLVGLAGKEQTEFELTNTNRLIRLYPGANGIKTGFTQEAGYCLSGSATKEDLTLIAVVLGCDTTHNRWGETMKLLDYGFAVCESAVLAKQGEILGTITVEKGSPPSISATTENDIKLLVKKGEKGGVTMDVSLFDNIKAPLKAGSPVGELIALNNGAEVGRYPLVAAEESKIAGLNEIYKRMLKTLI